MWFFICTIKKSLKKTTKNYDKVLLEHDNARPHVAKKTQEHISTNLKWEVLPHPPYSSDLAPSDFYLFRVLDNEIKGKFFKEKDLKLWIQKFFDSKHPKFFRRPLKDSWRGGKVRLKTMESTIMIK